MYKQTGDDSIIRISDGAVIPNDKMNTDRCDFDKWVANGGVVLPYEEIDMCVDDLRRAAYPPIGDQLDAIWKYFDSDSVDMDSMLDKVKAVKAKYPKG